MAPVASSTRSNFPPTGSLLALPLTCPNSHDGVAFLSEANSMDLDGSGVAVIAKFKNLAGLQRSARDLHPHVKLALRLSEGCSLG